MGVIDLSIKASTTIDPSHVADSGGAIPESFVGRTMSRLARVLTLESTPDERREHRRVPAHGTVQLQIAESPESEQEASGNLLDICPRGMSFRTKKAVPVGDTVMLNDGRVTVSGVVRRCSPDGKEFALGIELQCDDDESSTFDGKVLTSGAG